MQQRPGSFVTCGDTVVRLRTTIANGERCHPDAILISIFSSARSAMICRSHWALRAPHHAVNLRHIGLNYNCRKKTYILESLRHLEPHRSKGLFGTVLRPFPNQLAVPLMFSHV
jgi:hypothetical protein